MDELQKMFLLAECEARKTKQIRLAPTDRELREAVRFYKDMLECRDLGVGCAKCAAKTLEGMSPSIEDQIRVMGTIIEIAPKYPDGNFSWMLLIDKAEKWGILDIIEASIERASIKETKR